MIKTRVLLLLLYFGPGQLAGQDEFIKMINDTIHLVKFVFEARIDSVQSFPGDESANPIPYSQALWKGKLGHFEDKNGTTKKSYSKIFITVCRVYKGKVPEKIILLNENPYVRMYAEISPRGDTLLGHIETLPSHGNSEPAMMPSRFYPITRLYWCFDVCRNKTTGYYTFKKLFTTPMNIKGSVPREDGSYDHGTLYAILGSNSFMSQKELSDYLNAVKTIKRNPKNRCSPK